MCSAIDRARDELLRQVSLEFDALLEHLPKNPAARGATIKVGVTPELLDELRAELEATHV